MVVNKCANMKIKRYIVHQIFKRDENRGLIPPQFSDACGAMNIGYASKIKERIVKSMGSESHSIRMEIINIDENSVFNLIQNYWKMSHEEQDFINLSKRLTYMLAEVQNNRRYREGVVIFVEGTVQAVDKPFICIIKAEMQDGFSLKKSDDNLDLSYIDKIFMTKNEKFQKIGLLINNAVKGRTIEAKDVDCYIFDSNTDTSIAMSKAEYFYKTFLGMDFRKDSDVLTKQFVQTTKEFIQNMPVEDVEKIELSTALSSYVRERGTQIINPVDFAKANFENEEVIDSYNKYLSDHSIPLESIHKNTNMLGNWLKTRSLVFSNKVKVQVPVDEFDDAVEIKKDKKSGETIVTIKGMMLCEK